MKRAERQGHPYLLCDADVCKTWMSKCLRRRVPSVQTPWRLAHPYIKVDHPRRSCPGV
jgi:hypothetical protein